MLELGRATLATSGRAVFVRAAPLAGAVGIASAIVFAPHGLEPRDVVRMMNGSVVARLAMWAVWTTLATPAVSPAFDAIGTRTIRSLRPSRAILLIVAAIVGFAQTPWVLLFARGAGAAAAALATFTAIAITSAFASRDRRLIASSVVVIALGAHAFMIAPAVVLAFVSVRQAWRGAFDEHGVSRLVCRSPAAIALAATYVARMIRSARGRFQAAAVMVFGGGAALALTLRNDPDARPIQRALVVLALPLSAACGLLAAPALETETRLLPLIRATRTRRFTLALAMALALATPSTAFAGTATIAAALAAHTSPMLAAASVAWSVAIASVIAVWARARRPSLFIAGVIAIAAAFTAGAATC